MSQAGAERRSLTEDERARLLILRNELWEDYSDEDKVRTKNGRVLTNEEWAWMKELILAGALRAGIAQGFATPNPFVLELDEVSEGRRNEILMIHPSHLPVELQSHNALETFRAIEVH